MNVLKQLSLEQIKELTYEEICNLIKSQPITETECDRLAIEYINTFFNNCVYVCPKSPGINMYHAIGLGNIHNVNSGEYSGNIEYNNRIRDIINKTDSATIIMDKIINNKINQKLYIMFIPIKMNSQTNQSLSLSFKDHRLTTSCQCNNIITKQEFERLRSGKNICSTCPQNKCYFTMGSNGIVRTHYNYNFSINEGKNNTKQSYNIRGYKLYKGTDFIAMTEEQIKEKYNINNIEDYIIDPQRDIRSDNVLNLDNHVNDYLVNDSELIKYMLPWKIYDMTKEEAPKLYDFTDYFNFIDMIKLKHTLKN